MEYTYKGIKSEAFELLLELRLRDSKEFFEQVKPKYKKLLLEPFTQLITDISPVMLEADPGMQLTPGVGKTISRIRRDTRFTKDKSLYRDTMWLFIRRQGLGWLDAPGFWFDISPVSYSYGCGMYSAPAGVMELMRAKIDENPKAIERINRNLKKQGCFELQGEEYKRSKGSHLPEGLRRWYDKRELFLAHSSGELSDLASPDFSLRLCEDYRGLIPAFKFLQSVFDEYKTQGGK